MGFGPPTNPIPEHSYILVILQVNNSANAEAQNPAYYISVCTPVVDSKVLHDPRCTLYRGKWWLLSIFKVMQEC